MTICLYTDYLKITAALAEIFLLYFVRPFLKPVCFLRVWISNVHVFNYFLLFFCFVTIYSWYCSYVLAILFIFMISRKRRYYSIMFVLRFTKCLPQNMDEWLFASLVNIATSNRNTDPHFQKWVVFISRVNVQGECN